MHFDPESEQVKLDIHVISNPQPYIFSLSVRDEEGLSNFSSVSRRHYSVWYSDRAGGSGRGDSNNVGENRQRGTIELSLAVSGAVDGKRITFFRLTADNGVVGSAHFEYRFAAERHDRESVVLISFQFYYPGPDDFNQKVNTCPPIQFTLLLSETL